MKDIIITIKKMAKQLTINISQLGEGSTKEQLHGDALELLLEIHKLETVYFQTYSDSRNTSTEKKQSHAVKIPDEDLVRHEINKIHRRLPSWANKQHQINSKILTLFLEMEEKIDSDITEQMLMEKYNNQPEFYRNFPQMKTVSSKNHGKVFDVQNGIIKIWEPIRGIVQEYKDIVFGK